MKFLKRNGREIKQKTDTPVSGWSRVRTLTVAGLFGLLPLTSCDKIPNGNIIWDQETLTERFKVIHNHSGGGSGEPTIISYNVFVSKNGEKYIGRIEQKDGFFKDVTEIESDNVDALFDEIGRKLDSEKISESTRNKQNAKVAFAKQVYKDNVSNKNNSSKGEITIKYKEK